MLQQIPLSKYIAIPYFVQVPRLKPTTILDTASVSRIVYDMVKLYEGRVCHSRVNASYKDA